MENEQDQQKVIPPVPVLPPKKKINIWMLTTSILVIILIGLGAYAFGNSQKAPQKPTTPQPSHTIITKAPVVPTVSQQLPTPTKEITPAPTSKKVSAGMTNQFFSPYTVTVPSGWVDAHTQNTASDTLTLTKGDSVLMISQVAGGAGSCDFPGDTPEPMSQVFTSFVGITGTFAQFRRGTTDNLTYTVCEQKTGGFVFPTSVGYITYKVLASTDQSTLAEMDGMVASLAK